MSHYLQNYVESLPETDLREVMEQIVRLRELEAETGSRKPRRKRWHSDHFDRFYPDPYFTA